MTPTKLAVTSLFALASLLATAEATAQDAALGPAVDGRVEGPSSAPASGSGSVAAPENSPASAPVATPDRDGAGDDDDDGFEDGQTGRPPRSKRTHDRIRGGAGLGGLAVFDDAGSGTLLQVQGRFGAQLNALFGIYGQLALAAGDMDQRGGVEGRAVYATFAVIPEFHVLDELAIGLGPVAMSGVRDVDQVGPRYRHFESKGLERFNRDDPDGDDRFVARYGLMLRVSPAIGKVMPSGRIHAFRPSFEVAVLGTDRDVLEPEQNVMVLAGVSLGWDTW